VKRRVVLIGIAAVLVAAAVTAVIVVLVSRSSDNPAADTPAASVTEVPFTVPQADVDVLKAGLVSSDPAVEAKALATILQTKANLEKEPLLPAGSSIKIDAGNALRYGDLASVPATVSGPRPGKFMLLLSKEGESWLMYGTEQLG
jgi:hypothetical protein